MTILPEMSEAVTILCAGGLVGMPTETVYGLAADATNPVAVAKIFAAKGRPADHPLIVHLADSAWLSAWARDIPDIAKQLAEAFWPGPLTLILRAQPTVSALITGGQSTIGLRVPAHPVAQALLKQFGRGLAAPSANRFGRISPTTAEAVREELGSKVDLVLEGGQCEEGIESTIVDVSSAQPRILRPGAIPAAAISAVLGIDMAANSIIVNQNNHKQTNKKNNHTVPRVSGALDSHYAPVTPVKLIETQQINDLLVSQQQDQHIAIVTWSLLQNLMKTSIKHVRLAADAKQYAHDLYAILRALDHQDLQMIYIEKVPETAAWDAVRDRLKRAAG